MKPTDPAPGGSTPSPAPSALTPPELVCHLHPGWQPRIRPASHRREWMDDTPDAFAYRCLPLAIANAHGWEVLSPVTFEARWNGGTGIDAIEIRLLAGGQSFEHPSSIFGHGVLTFHVFGLLRTSPGWNLWVGGPANAAKDGIAPLGGVIETDWSPYTFTMNWRFTRPDQWVRFDENEPICSLFPIPRGVLERMQPRVEAMAPDSDLFRQFKAWSASRDAFQKEMERNPPKAPADRWQKRYFHGRDMHDQCPAGDHQTKMRLKPFVDAQGHTLPLPAATPVPAATRMDASPRMEDTGTNDNGTDDIARIARALELAAPDLIFADRASVIQSLGSHGFDAQTSQMVAEAGLQHPLSLQGRRAVSRLRKREWLLQVQERQRELSAQARQIPRLGTLDSEEFLHRFYAPGRPLILTGMMESWPALQRWNADYLAQKIGTAVVEFQGDRDRNARFERDKTAHTRRLPFDQFIDLIRAPDAGNRAYLTAYNSASNAQALSPLSADLGRLDALLAADSRADAGMLWIGPAGTFTPLHHDLTNNLVAQLVGRKHLRLIAAAHVGALHNDQHVFSEIEDLDQIDLSMPRHAGLRDVQIYDVTLAPGEMLFIPIGWWHQVRSLDFSVTITYTNFRWRNDGSQGYPQD